MFVKAVKKDEYTFSGCEIGNIYEVYEDRILPYALILEEDRDKVGKRWLHKDSCKTITFPDCKHYGCDNNVCSERSANSINTMECFEEKDFEYYSNKDRIIKESKTMFVKIINRLVGINRRFEIGEVCKVCEYSQEPKCYRLVEDPQQLINKCDCKIVEEPAKQADKNYIAETAKMYGVEIGEQFKIQHAYTKSIFDAVYFFDNTLRNGLFIVGKPDDATSMIKYLVKGECTILKMPWKPKIGESYFYNGVKKPKVGSAMWEGNMGDYAMYTLGNCYKTEELAAADRENALKRLGVEND